MKKIFLSYIWCVVALAFFAACADEEIATGTVQIEKGIPVTVSLNYDVMAATSRTAQSEAVENKVNRVYAIAFHSDGTVSGRNSAEIVSGNSITLYMQSGAGQKIFLIANYDSGIGSLGLDELRNVNSYDEFKNLSSSLTEGYETQVERMSFLMVGQMKNISGGEDINIDTDGKILNSTGKIQLNRVDARITFNVFAKNDSYTNFTFQPRYYRVERIPQGTYLVPQELDYKSTTGESYVSMSEKNEQKNFDGVREVDNQNAYYFEFYLLENRQSSKKRITESEKTVKTDSYDNTETENLYALREKRYKVQISDEDKKVGQDYQLGNWVYANENSTYVIIRGTLSYEDQNNNQFINADVTYTVHLGSTGNSSTTNNWYDDEDLVNKYATERNTHYTYNVTITGVHSIEVEVNEDKEGRPGVEGDVIVAGGKVEDMDAHYGRTMFTLTRGDILDGLSWAFSTPFQRGMKVFNQIAADSHDESQLKTDLSLNDYKWVKFAINREYPQKDGVSTYYSTDKLVKFPGEDAYNGGTGTNSPAPAYGGNGVSSEYYGKHVVKLYDVNQLLNHLYEEAKNPASDIFMKGTSVSNSVNDRDATVTITAFVDEYVYVCDPTKYYYRAPKPVGENEEGVDLTLWKKVVNGDNRMLHICVAGAQYSPDGNSSWANSVISFSQRPIYTFYNPNDAGLKTAWGVESKGETGEIGVELTGTARFGDYYTNTSDNGRKNTLNILYSTGSRPSFKGLEWDQVVSVDNAGNLLGDYNSIWYACLLRNRDLNGDNIVDEDEIRWYLASIDQLTDIWVGEAAIPTAKLYTKTASSNSVPMEHVACSSYFNNGGYNTPWIIWAEESASRGGYKNGGEDKYDSDGIRSYRTVRNLGISLDEVDAVPDDYVIKTSGTYTTGGVTYTEKIIDVSRMNSNAIRPSAANILLPYPLLERDENNNNRPPRKFAIIEKASNYTSGLYPRNKTSYWLDIYENESQGSPCPSGYRVPNQRELMLMYTTYPELFSKYTSGNSNSEYLCKTGFSFKDWGAYKGNNRLGFVYDVDATGSYGNLRLIDSNFSGKVRCVRDVVE